MKQTVMLTVLPQGISGENRLRLSVHVNLRLEPTGGTGQLADFDDAKNWADTDLAFGVSFNGGDQLPASIVTDPARDPALWHALFDGGADVKGKPFTPYATFPVVSWPTKSVLDFIQQTYTQLAVASPDDHPLVDDLIPLFGEVAFTEHDEKKADQFMEEMRQERESSNKRFNEFEQGSSATPAHHFLALKRFYTRPGQIVPVEPPNFDFHEVLALLAQHPPLLRMLGLVFDLELGGGRVAPVFPATGVVQVTTPWEPTQPTTAIVRPHTHYEFDFLNGVFATRPRDPQELKRGHLRLGDGGRYDLVTIDPDGAGLKVLNFASSLKRAKLAQTQNGELPARKFTVPSLRSAGLSIVRRERAKTFVPKLDVAVATNDAIVAMAADPITPPPEVWREDVTTGYAIDVWDGASQEWHSLVRREGTYDFPGGVHVPLPETEEASLVSAPALPADPAAERELYLQQSLFQWMGWSLAVAPPGLPIQKNDAVGPDPADPAAPAVPLGFTLDVPDHSLPRLRYGREYRVRMRAVDITGGRVPFVSAAQWDDPELVAAETYYRWETIPSPVLTFVEPRTEAEAVDHLVIRSDYTGPIAMPGLRHVVPPKAAVHTAEQHGKLDVGNPSVVDGSEPTYDFLNSREAKSLNDVPGAVVDPNDPGGAGAPTVYIPVDFALPYLPDPLVQGAAFRALPGGTPAPGVDGYDFAPGPATPWHALRPFRIEVTQPAAGGGLGPPAAPFFTAADRTLHVELPKAAVVRVPFSCIPVAGALGTLGIWSWIAGASPPNLAALQTAAEQGAHWMISPFRPLTLVHAVRRPLKTPEFTAASSARELGQTFATIKDRLHFSRKSTGKIDVYGTWDEWIDEDPDPTTPKTPPVETLAFQPPLAQPGETPSPDDDLLEMASPHEFGDTKHRVITYRAVATTKFAEYFVQRQKHTVSGATINLVSSPETVIPESLKVKDVKTGKVYTRPDDYMLNGASTGIVPTDLPNGEEVEISFLVPPHTRDTVGPPGPRTVNVKSSARPSAPKVLYIVPTFKRPPSAPLSRSRQAAGVRVYLDRPWWSSGGGEQLGVLLWKPVGILAFDPPNRLQPYVTRWGLDPLFASGSLPARNPLPAHFPLTTTSMSNLALDELPGDLVDVAGHQVGFDFERKLWYCDIDITASTAYTPFLRFAFARFQPDSLPGAHLSRVVLADYIQVAPNRAVTIVPKPGRGNPKLTVTVSGLTYQRNFATTGPGVAHAILEQRDPSKGPADELGWSQVGNPFPLAPVASNNPIVGIWSGDVTLPSARTPGKFRIVVEQFEQIPTGPFIGPGLALGRRLVYSDIVSV